MVKRLCIPFEIDHVRQIVEINRREHEHWVVPDIIDQWAKTWEGRLWAYTLTADGIPFACAGVSLQEWNKGEAWAVFSTEFKKHRLFIYRFFKAGIEAAIHENKLVRLQATIDPQYPADITWIEKLGFEYEGRLRKYGPQGQDYLMYSRVREWHT